MQYIENEKTIEKYIECLRKRILDLQKDLKGKEEKFVIDLKAINHFQKVTEFNTMKTVLDDLMEIINHQKEEERIENNTIESFWKDWNK